MQLKFTPSVFTDFSSTYASAGGIQQRRKNCDAHLILNYCDHATLIELPLE